MKKLESSLMNMVIVLTLISVIAGGTLAYINKVTQEPIAAINAKNLQDGIKKVIIGTTDGELNVEHPDTVDTYIIYKTDKGTAVKSTTNGFGGALEVLVGFDSKGSIMGYTILSTVETPGLGVKADSWFQKDGKGNIIGRNPGEKTLSVKQDGGDVDAITASTITSRAFLNAVNNAYNAYMSKGADATSGATQQSDAMTGATVVKKDSIN